MDGKVKTAVRVALLWRGVVLLLLLLMPGARAYVAVGDAICSAVALLFALRLRSRETEEGATPANPPAPPEDSPDRKALQQNLLLNQMNPHFLYNTLESIRGKAIIDGNVQVADMVEALSAFFRYNVSYHSAIVTLADELNNVNEYLKIQNFRFEERFRVEQKIDETIDAKACYLPKLTLQPIVENAIVHGLESLEEGGLVTIYATDLDQMLLLSVTDNGVGMNEAALQRLCASLGGAPVPGGTGAQDKSDVGGIALINVQQRIQLVFGKEYGLRVYSMEGAGTTVELLIPKRDSSTLPGGAESL